MKKLAAYVSIFAAVAILGTALIRAASDDKTSSTESASSNTLTKSTTPCCDSKSTEGNQQVVAKTMTACCDESEAVGRLLAESSSCTGEACQASDGAAVGCGMCASNATKHADKTAVATEDKGEATSSNEAQCTSCPVAGQPAAASTKKCEFCAEESCKTECSSCAESRREQAPASNVTQAAHSPGKGPAAGNGHAGGSQHAKDHQDFFYLIEHRDTIHRKVKNIANGVETLTESDVASVGQMIQVHVEAMYDRLENGNPIRMRDPLFREVFVNADKIKMVVEHTDYGVRVRETSEDAYVVKLIQAHAKVVSLWIKNGYSELPKNHPAPTR